MRRRLLYAVTIWFLALAPNVRAGTFGVDDISGKPEKAAIYDEGSRFGGFGDVGDHGSFRGYDRLRIRDHGGYGWGGYGHDDYGGRRSGETVNIE